MQFASKKLSPTLNMKSGLGFYPHLLLFYRGNFQGQATHIGPPVSSWVWFTISAKKKTTIVCKNYLYFIIYTWTKFAKKLQERICQILFLRIKYNICYTFCTLREKCPSTEFFLVRILPHSDQIWENTDQKKLSIWTLALIFIRKSEQLSKTFDKEMVNVFHYVIFCSFGLCHFS